MAKPILLLDFDGVIHSYKSGWQGARCIPDPPTPGALEFLCKAQGYFQVCIYSSRSRQFGGKLAMKQWLWDRYAEIGGVKRRSWFLGPFGKIDAIPEPPKWWYRNILAETHMEPWEHEVNNGINKFLKKVKFPTKKPAAFLTIDDRAIRFSGEFPDPKNLLDFKPWNKRKV